MNNSFKFCELRGFHTYSMPRKNPQSPKMVCVLCRARVMYPSAKGVKHFKLWWKPRRVDVDARAAES